MTIFGFVFQGLRFKFEIGLELERNKRKKLLSGETELAEGNKVRSFRLKLHKATSLLLCTWEGNTKLPKKKILHTKLSYCPKSCIGRFKSALPVQQKAQFFGSMRLEQKGHGDKSYLIRPAHLKFYLSLSIKSAILDKL